MPFTLFFFKEKKQTNKIMVVGENNSTNMRKKEERKKMKQLQTRFVLGKRLDRVKQVNIQLECRNFI